MNSENQAIIEAMRSLHGLQFVQVQDPTSPANVPLLLVPEGLKTFDPKALLDQWLDRPRAIKGTATAETLASFCDLVNQHKTLATVIFAQRGTSALEAVIDYHDKSDLAKGSVPAWCQHRIVYTFPKSAEFRRWETANQWRSQSGFAAFLDGARFDLADPLDVDSIPEGSLLHDVLTRSTARENRGRLHDALVKTFASPGDLAQLVESLTAHTKTKFAEVKVDRFGGMRATIEREGRVDGDERIPSLFLVDVPAFVGGDKVTVPARIRARIEGGALQLCAELIGVDRVLEAAFDEAIKEAHAKTSVAVFRGSCER
jgi:uncharacterized protein YfdQ (DUF2303 family)